MGNVDLADSAFQEMASEERRAADKRIREENLFKTLGAEEVQAETDAFQCGRCKQVCSHSSDLVANAYLMPR